jgi:hypothetical protein
VKFDPRAARAALVQLPELAAQESLVAPAFARVFVPTQHIKALHLDASVVVGMRGAGKSWWTAVLASDAHRQFIARQLQGSSLGSSLGKVVARVGFGLDETDREFPRAETLRDLAAEVDPQDIWQAVILRHMLRVAERPVPFEGQRWKDAVRWLGAHRDEANRLLTEADAQLAESGRVLLVLFDAFDRLAGNWDTVRGLTAAALKLGLRLRSRRSIRTKFFIRPDLEEDEKVWQFPDASKLRHAKVDLAWASVDLYGLVFMHLGNAVDFGVDFRDQTNRGEGLGWSESGGVHVPAPRVSEEPLQERVVEALADRTMGGGPKRGCTYTWIPLHLADAKGRISPRSYLLAFKKAAEYTAETRPDHTLALHYTAIQQGVVKASTVRVDEIGEDYPWIKPLLEAARDAVVPMASGELSRRWTPDCLDEMVRAGANKLPPRRYTSDPLRSGKHDALIDDLVELAVLYRTTDRRLNMPDIFRVGYGIRRKGGVRPPH